MERPSWDASQRRPSISSQTSSTSLRWWWWWWSTLMSKIPDQEQIHFLRNDWGEPRRLHLSPRGTLITMVTIMMTKIFLTTNTPHLLRPSSRRSLSSESYSSSDTSPEGAQLSYYNRLARPFTSSFWHQRIAFNCWKTNLITIWQQEFTLSTFPCKLHWRRSASNHPWRSILHCHNDSHSHTN